MARSLRAFVLRHTTLRSVPGLEPIRLHLADDLLAVWRAAQIETHDPDAPLPYWTAAWGGGQAIARYLRDNPDAVARKRILDLGSGSGLCAIAAMNAGAERATSVDIDPFAAAAIEVNARANGCRIALVTRDILDDEPPDVDVVLAGDCWYEARLAERVTPWLRAASQAGIDVLVGDPGRRYLPTDELVELAVYDARTTAELEDLERTQARVYRLRDREGAGS
ncbi:MAG: class I SAM-dependent methyltransferase [Chloroflexota bacterium]